MFKRVLTIMLVGAAVATPAAASRQVCGDRASLLAELLERFGEKPVGQGVSSAGALVELLVSDPTAPGQTWSIVVSVPGGPTCLRAAGEGWRPVSSDRSGPKT